MQDTPTALSRDKKLPIVVYSAGSMSSSSPQGYSFAPLGHFHPALSPSLLVPQQGKGEADQEDNLVLYYYK
jgi:hypothetical protein